MALRDIFIDLISKFSPNAGEQEWNELQQRYSGKGRHYHTMAHLEALWQQLDPIAESIEDWDVLLFTLFYHDAVYDALKKDNEEKSAELARERMTVLGVEAGRIERCVRQILATKGHSKDEDEDTNYFTDADLSILGQEWSVYEAYAKNVRKEYKIYPDLVYKPGRRKVLEHFLKMPQIFKTKYFFTRFEDAARANLAKELTLL